MKGDQWWKQEEFFAKLKSPKFTYKNKKFMKLYTYFFYV